MSFLVELHYLWSLMCQRSLRVNTMKYFIIATTCRIAMENRHSMKQSGRGIRAANSHAEGNPHAGTSKPFSQTLHFFHTIFLTTVPPNSLFFIKCDRMTVIDISSFKLQNACLRVTVYSDDLAACSYTGNRPFTALSPAWWYIRAISTPIEFLLLAY